MRILALAVAAVVASGAFAANAQKDEMVRIGGEGRLVFVNAAGIDDEPLAGAADIIGKMLMIETEVRKGTWTLADADRILGEIKATAAVFVVSDRTLPISLIAMESKWGVVNAANLTPDQTRKETLRVAAVVLGAAASKYQSSVMRPAFSADDLEKKAGNLLTIDQMMAIYPNLGAFGFSQFQVLNYREALEEEVEGLPPPANEAQRRIKAEFDRKAKK